MIELCLALEVQEKIFGKNIVAMESIQLSLHVQCSFTIIHIVFQRDKQGCHYVVYKVVLNSQGKKKMKFWNLN